MLCILKYKIIKKLIHIHTQTRIHTHTAHTSLHKHKYKHKKNCVFHIFINFIINIILKKQQSTTVKPPSILAFIKFYC